MTEDERLHELSAAFEVSNLVGRYERLYDEAWDDPAKQRALLDLFVEDCDVDYGAFGSVNGRDELADLLDEYYGAETGTTDSFHLTSNPWIEIDGDVAVGRWHFFGAYVIAELGATWIMGFYEFEFARENDEWLIETLTFEPKWVSPYESGWAEEPFAV